MKSTKSLLMLYLLVGLSFLCSFVSPAGGEGFEIFVDNKVVLHKFNTQMKTISNLSFNATHAKSELTVKFYHCGMIGKDRSLFIRDAQQRTLKQWVFTNSEAKNYEIKVPIKELLALQQKNGNAILYLYYASKEASTGRLLAGIVKNTTRTAAAK